MKSFDLLDPQDFERAVEESGLDVGVLRAIRFGMVYGGTGKDRKLEDMPAQEPIRVVDDLGENVVNLAAYKLFRGFQEI